jgi:hypothetical protein
MRPTTKKKSKSVLESDYYGFGQKSAALLALLLTGDGELTVLAYRRPVRASSTKPYDDMVPLYVSEPLKLGKAGVVPFRLTLDAKRVGLLSIEPRGWDYPYEVNRTHFLGAFNPFTTEEIPYQDFGGTNRRKGIAANRVFDGKFIFDPQAVAPTPVAQVTLTDVESGGQSLEAVNISAFDNPTTGKKGGVFVAIRVNEANYFDGCATLEFTGGHTVSVPVNGQATAVSRLFLNTGVEPTFPLRRTRLTAKKKSRK